MVNCGCGQDQSAAVGRKFLSHIPQAADDHRIIHVAMKIFQNEGSLDRDGFKVGQRLSRFAAVVDAPWQLGTIVTGRIAGVRSRVMHGPASRRPVVHSIPHRANPLAIVHSKAARFKAAQAARTMRTARISSTVSITTMGVEESMQDLQALQGLAISV